MLQKKDQANLLHTLFSVLFLNSFAVGIENTTKREYRTDFGLKCKMLKDIAVYFSNVHCVHSLAESPWRPNGMWSPGDGWFTAHCSPIRLACCQYSATSALHTLIWTWSIKKLIMRCGCKIGYVSTLKPVGDFLLRTGTLIDSISSDSMVDLVLRTTKKSTYYGTGAACMYASSCMYTLYYIQNKRYACVSME